MGSGHIEADEDHLVKVMADALDMVATSMERDDPRVAVRVTAEGRMVPLHICHVHALMDLAQSLYESHRVSAEGVRHIRGEVLRSFGAAST